MRKISALITFVALASLGALASAQTDVRAVFIAGPSDQGVREVAINDGALAALMATGGEVRLHGFPMPQGGSATLLIEPFEVLTPDATVVLGDPEGDVEIGAPDVTLYRGKVEGDHASAVFLSFSPHGTHGVIRHNHELTVLTSGPFGEDVPMVVADLRAFPEPPEFARGFACNARTDHLRPFEAAALARGEGGFIANNPCRIARVAIDTDFEFTSWKFGGDVDASAAYCVTIIGAVSEIFTRDLNVRLLVPFVRVWADNNDPYNGGNLDAFRTEWNANMGHVERDLAHKLSGNYGGGVAWVSVLCHPSYGYALSGVNGSFPYPLRDHQGGNWDPFVVAHELGHNFGTLHTHDGYNPTIDDCGNGDCSDAYGGTIMSYCHICSGGMTNISLRFHERVITQVSNYMNGACDLTSRLYAYDDDEAAIQGEALVIDPLANDISVNCEGIVLHSVDSASQNGGTITVSTGTGQDGRDEVVYTSAPDFAGLDSFTYRIYNGGRFTDAATVYVQVARMRDADTIGTSRPGLAADYYELQAPQNLPDFDALAPYLSATVRELDYPGARGLFAGSGRSLDVGAVFESAFMAPQTGLYTLFIESDDGSRLYVGDELLIENDGVHEMRERSGTIGLRAGPHRLRVEFFQQSAARGLIVSAEGPGMSRRAIPESMWRNDRCVADWSLDAQVNTQDVILFLADWNLRVPHADVTADGIIDSRDVLAFLTAWSSGC